MQWSGKVCAIRGARSRVAVVLCAAFLIQACAAGGSTSAPAEDGQGAAGTTAAAGGEARVSIGCGVSAPVAPGESAAFTLQVGALEREYRLHLPPSYDATRPVSLVLDFHGYTGRARGEERYTGLSRHADENGYAVVYPQGTGFAVQSGDRTQNITSWNDLSCNASPGPEGAICTETASEYPHPPECGEPSDCNWCSCNDDVGFVADLLDTLEATVCVDLDRVYATGMSNGGMFVHRLGCDLAERFAAVAPVGGTLARGFNCAPAAPLSLMNIYGTSDTVVVQDGNVSADGYLYTSAAAAVAKWASPASQSCRAEPVPYETVADGTLGLACTQHADCATGAEVVSCVWDGAHDWPTSEDREFGNEIIWDFFSKHSRAGYR